MESNLSRKVNHSSPMMETNTADDDLIWNTTREYHKEPSATYWLPKDEEEQMRLTGLQFAVKELFKGVAKSLNFEDNLAILDIGCGPGAWIMDMSTDYPNCTYAGCDIADMIHDKIKPSQFTFQLGNITERLPYENNTFELAQMRFFVACLRKDQWPDAIKEALRVIKPGGILQMIEIDLKKTEELDPVVEKYMDAIYDECKARGQDPRIVSKLESMLLNSCCELIETSYQHIDFRSPSNSSKRFLWTWIQGAKSTLPILGPKMGIHDKEAQNKFVSDLRHACLTTSSSMFIKAIVVQKLTD
ncbi:hypothetical protein G6F29_009886 [Rhizopus arrhizus]|nr:hypothetical protein G6F15_002291 [Rhizopus arrhizus]KAG0893758.1 hypothetical protein G6F34_009711 [Rhizopus arrhizus]KAG0977672.1 hypothetical protein G6F29_009886 [Rhizopus arrhizus]KAG0990136.1 hypothetical protein G6F28_009378 [Rhizopus arrhizus]KAG1034498.1 hypothetical protein G6F25_009608 [Rhizopus arrhizus]